MMFALVISTIVVNLVQIVRIRYGEELVTKLTIKPYYLAMGLLVFQLIEIVAFLTCQEIVYEGN